MDALCWIDIETTGLDPNKDKILEVYCRVTDFNFSTLYDFNFLVTYPYDVNMSEIPQVVIDMHNDSGLWEELTSYPPDKFYNRKHSGALDADFSGHLHFAKKQYDIDKFYPAGSSVHFDIGFLTALGLPMTMEMLSHRHFDVTTLKLFMMTQTGFYPEFEEVTPKHRAYSDVESSIIAAKAICAPMVDTSLHAAHVAKVMEARGNEYD